MITVFEDGTFSVSLADLTEEDIDALAEMAGEEASEDPEFAEEIEHMCDVIDTMCACLDMGIDAGEHLEHYGTSAGAKKRWSKVKKAHSSNGSTAVNVHSEIKHPDYNRTARNNSTNHNDSRTADKVRHREGSRYIRNAVSSRVRDALNSAKRNIRNSHSLRSTAVRLVDKIKERRATRAARRAARRLKRNIY